MVGLQLAGCRLVPADSASAPAQQALRRGLDFLERTQGSDGSWRSEFYRDMAGGFELTPGAAKALLFAGRDASTKRAIQFMDQGLDPKTELIYPVYTASEMLLLLSRAPYAARRTAWRKVLLSFQLGEANGWSPDDPDFGGWGYALRIPRKGQPDPLAHSNLTSTTFALGALRVSGLPETDPAVQAGKVFALRCQGPDGGFFAAPNDSVLNKAGPGVSYGTATADGVRSLLRCGCKLDDPALQRGVTWMMQHFDEEKVSGEFPQARFEDRDSLYYYYAWSNAHALAALQRAGSRDDRSAMARALIRRLVAQQRPDGSWRNPLSGSREDDPLVATPFALAALFLCQGMAP